MNQLNERRSALSRRGWGRSGKALAYCQFSKEQRKLERQQQKKNHEIISYN
jgi:hypothetical protein